MSLPLALQEKFYALLATKRMTVEQRDEVMRRYVAAWGAGKVRVLIREMEALPDMSADDAWDDIEAEFEGLPFLGEA